MYLKAKIKLPDKNVLKVVGNLFSGILNKQSENIQNVVSNIILQPIYSDDSGIHIFIKFQSV